MYVNEAQPQATSPTTTPTHRPGVPVAVSGRARRSRTKRQLELPAMSLVQSPRWATIVAKALTVLLLLMVPMMGLVPWQQTARGTGRVVAYAPLDRQQTIDSPISGRISYWSDRIVEGAEVTRGEVLLQIEDNDPELIQRLEKQKTATESKLKTAEMKAEAYGEQVTAFTEARMQILEAARQMVMVAEQRLRGERQALEAARAAELQSELNYQRQKKLASEGLASGLAAEIETRKYREAQAMAERAQANVEAAQNELEARRAELQQKDREAQTKVDYARAMQQDALGQAAMSEKDMQEIESRLAQQKRQTITAPRDGTIMRLLVNQEGQMVKFGDPLAVLVPETADRAVELWVDGNDTPLVTPGRHVRLQFEGWPAVQFAGWPSVAVGTFGGEVAVVDATDDGTGRFRVLIRPDEDQDWPTDRFLRQGVRANGWVLLNQVPLGYEIWRQLNGFPPVLDDQPQGGGKDDLRKVKLPK